MAFVFSIAPSSYPKSFTQANLVENILTLHHGLRRSVVNVVVYNASGEQVDVKPQLVDDDNCTVDFTLIAPISGTYKALVTA